MPPEDIDADLKPPIDPEYPHRYYFTYAYQPLGTMGFGLGGYAVGLRLPVRGADDVLYVKSLIEQANPTFTKVTVTGWQKFED